jgi:hypothetical protein
MLSADYVYNLDVYNVAKTAALFSASLPLRAREAPGALSANWRHMHTPQIRCRLHHLPHRLSHKLLTGREPQQLHNLCTDVHIRANACTTAYPTQTPRDMLKLCVRRHPCTDAALQICTCQRNHRVAALSIYSCSACASSNFLQVVRIMFRLLWACVYGSAGVCTGAIVALSIHTMIYLRSGHWVPVS